VLNRIPSFASYRKIDDFTVEITTKFANSLLPFEATAVLFSSPAQYEAVGRNWAAFAAKPSGTGPFKLDRLVPRERAELVRNAEYWDPKRVPKLDRVILLPIPEATQRTAALLSGRIDWNEAPAPDTLPALKASGMRVVLNPYPHNWTYQPSVVEGGSLCRYPGAPGGQSRDRPRRAGQAAQQVVACGRVIELRRAIGSAFGGNWWMLGRMKSERRTHTRSPCRRVSM
jgi:hypothetical protein